MRFELRLMPARAVKAVQVTGAFLWMGYMEALAYPLALALTVARSAAPPIIYYFVSRLVDSGASVGDNYYTFALIGIVTTAALAGGLVAFGFQLDTTLQQGRFETLLIEPIPWRIIPFGLAALPILMSAFTALIGMLVGLALGADIRLSGVLPALVVLTLGIASGHAVGILAASVKVLAKRSDPVLVLYELAASVFSGVLFPISVLPAPLRVISYCLPQTYVLSAMRRLLMIDTTGISGPSAWEAVLLLVGFLTVAYPFGLWLYGRALEYGRKIGVLAGY